MPLAVELLAQARILATIDPGVPSQANLRRAISAAYYAVFHLLISEAVATLVPVQPRGLGDRVSRSFNHNEMQKICLAVVKTDLADKFGILFGSGISSNLRVVAERFSVLQQARHAADYDVGQLFSRSLALTHIENAELAFQNWSPIRNTEEATVFLTALAFGARWAK
jgi:hypothetical protein